MDKRSIDIWLFIKNYLVEGKEIILPGLGIFSIQYIPSSLDPVANKLMPPRKKIIFEENSKVENLYFYKLLSNYYKISLPEATSITQLIVADLVQELKNSNYFEAKGFGVFKGAPGFIQFQPNNFAIFIDAFGLPEVKVKNQPVVAKKITVEKKQTIEETPESAEEMRIKALNELKQLLDKSSSKQQQANHKQKTGKYFPYIATALTVILLINVLIYLNKETFSPLSQTVSQMAMGSPKIDTENTTEKLIAEEIKREDKSEVNVETNYLVHSERVFKSLSNRTVFFEPKTEPLETEIQKFETAESDELKSNIDEVAVISETKTMAKNENIAKKDIVYMVARAEANNIEKGFYIVAGVFSIEENANNFVKNLHNKGFKKVAKLKPLKFKNYMVVFNKYSNRREAEVAHTEFLKENPEAWIYEAR
ncbi:MAG: hypothetical protein ACK4K9_00975 [Bacteroidia bacterium]